MRHDGARARIVVGRALVHDNGALLWDTPVAGVPLLTRQLLGLRQAGVDDVSVAAEPDLHAALRQILDQLPCVDGRRVALVDVEQPVDGSAPGTVVLPVDIVIDSRAIEQMIAIAQREGQSVACVDRLGPGYPAFEKSPFQMGAPGRGAGRVVDATADQATTEFHSVGVKISLDASPVPSERGGEMPLLLDVGLYQWHRVRNAVDAAKATAKILLGTIKPTDGIYARLNRRVSLRISQRLLSTPVTPNQVTLFTLGCGAVAGLVMAGGTYASFVLGGILTWFASVLDGVDGEIARAKLQTSSLGHWLEMASDYAFNLAVVCGYGAGLYRADGSRAWLYWAAVGVAGVVLSFVAVARTKRAYERREPDGDYYVAFQRTTSAHASNPVHFFTRYTTFLVTRAVFPYYIVLFAVLGLSKAMFVIALVATQLAWMLTLYTSRLRLSVAPPVPDQTVTPRSVLGSPHRVLPAADEP